MKMHNDNFNINITMTSGGRKFKLVKSKRIGCRGCAFNKLILNSCPMIAREGHMSPVFPCHQLGQSFVWKEVNK